MSYFNSIQLTEEEREEIQSIADLSWHSVTLEKELTEDFINDINERVQEFQNRSYYFRINSKLHFILSLLI